jgi:hypothetical protein
VLSTVGWFAPKPTIAKRLFIVVTLLWIPSICLYVWCRLTPRWYDGALSSQLGALVTAGAADVLERNAGSTKDVTLQ